MLSVKFYITPEKLQGIINGQVSGTSVNDLNLNAEVIEILSVRGFISLEPAIDIYEGCTQQGIEIGKLFARSYILFCGIFGFEPVSDEGYKAFLDKVKNDVQGGPFSETAQVVEAASMAIEEGILTMEMLWELIAFSASSDVMNQLYKARETLYGKS
ncbi:hypothetical protein BH24DEI2_BH24DEI2_19230 [soil metagenome]